jgi:DNA-binding LytR/AlgR family response regulator
MKPSVVFIRKDDRQHKLQVQDILFIRANGSYLEIVTPAEIFSVSQNLSQFMRRNPIPGLVRVHRSFIVNLNWLDSFDHEFVYLGSHQIPIGDSFRTKFMKGIHNF